MNIKVQRNHQEIPITRNRTRYTYISLELRTTLIKMVVKQGYSVYRASKILQINNSTAKVILRNFRNRGHIYRRKKQKNAVEYNVEQQFGGISQQFQNRNMPQQSGNDNDREQDCLSQAIEVDPSSNYYMYLCYPMCYFNQVSFGFMATELLSINDIC